MAKNKTLWAGGLVLAVVLGACAPEDEVCPIPEGRFMMQYVALVQGGCGALPRAHMVTLDPGRGGVSQTQERRTVDDVHTDVNYKGCEVALEQKVLARDEDQVLATTLISSVTGSMDIDNEARLTGVLHRTEYDTATATITCDGFYEAELFMPDATTGAAAR